MFPSFSPYFPLCSDVPIYITHHCYIFTAFRKFGSGVGFVDVNFAPRMPYHEWAQSISAIAPGPCPMTNHFEGTPERWSGWEYF